MNNGVFTGTKTIAIPPGMILAECLENNEISLLDFAISLKTNESYINKLINGQIEIDEVVAECIEDSTGVKKDFWIKLEKKYREDIEIVRKELQQPSMGAMQLAFT